MLSDYVKIEDFRASLPRATWSIGTRRGTRNFTLHYNGPAVGAFGYPNGERSQLISDARYHMRKDAFGPGAAGDGIMYHGATLSDGTSLQMRDWMAKLWHAGNAEPNEYGIAWHLPLGGAQRPTAAQRASVFAVIAAARLVWPGITVAAVKGHCEWKATSCPGQAFEIVKSYRAGDAPATLPSASMPPVQWFRTRYPANTREAPDPEAAIALHGAAVWGPGITFAVDKIIEDGMPWRGVPVWVHRADGVGFIHLSAVEPILATR